jgi:hypothetical protein
MESKRHLRVPFYYPFFIEMNFAFVFLKNVKVKIRNSTANQNKDHSGTCKPKIEGSFAEQSPSALKNQGITLAN